MKENILISFSKYNQRNKCPNHIDGIHKGIKHNRFGDGCCTCGVYMVFNSNQVLSDINDVKRDSSEDWEWFIKELEEKE